MASYAILRMEKRKLGAVTKICNHHERLKERYKSNPDIDVERSAMNYHLCKPRDKYRPMILHRIEESGAKMRKNSVVLQDCLVTASPEWINELSYEKQVEFFDHAFEYFGNTFGRENIISAVVHMDEANPHMHVCFVPLTKDNRLSSKEIIGGPKGLVKHQDDFYEHMAEKFPDLNRGISSKITHRKHIPTQVYKSADLLMSHYEELTHAVNDIGMINNAKKKDEVIALLGKYAPEMAKMKSQLKMTDRHITELEDALSESNRIAYGYRDKAFDQEEEIKQLKDKLSELNYKQRKLLNVIDKIPSDVLEQMKRDELARRRHEREER